MGGIHGGRRQPMCDPEGRVTIWGDVALSSPKAIKCLLGCVGSPLSSPTWNPVTDA